MNLLSWLAKAVVVGATTTYCIGNKANAQVVMVMANVIDTASRPQLFAEGVVSTPYTEWATSFTPDGKTVYFSQGTIYWTMCYSKLTSGKWAKPQVVNISGRWRDTDPFITPDGKRLFFVSNRPLDGKPESKAQSFMHVWYADRTDGDDWGQPHHLADSINLDGISNYATSVSKAGTLYFSSRDRGGHNGMSSYYCKWLGDHFDKPKLLALRGNEEIQDPYIAPDESYLLFESGPDLYICYKKGNGWGEAQNLGKQVNNGDYNSSPSVSPDGKMLYYSSGRIQGLFVPRKPANKPVDYDGLLKEMQSNFNGEDNILVIPIHILKANS